MALFLSYDCYTLEIADGCNLDKEENMHKKAKMSRHGTSLKMVKVCLGILSSFIRDKKR